MPRRHVKTAPPDAYSISMLILHDNGNSLQTYQRQQVVAGLHRRASSMNCEVVDVQTNQRLLYALSSSLIVGRTRLSTVGDRAFRMLLLVSRTVYPSTSLHCSFIACLPVMPQDSCFLLFPTPVRDHVQCTRSDTFILDTLIVQVN